MMANEHNHSAHSECSLIKQQLHRDLCQLSTRELEELGASRASISQTVDSIAVGYGCNNGSK